MPRSSASPLDLYLKAIGFDQCSDRRQTSCCEFMCQHTVYLTVSILATSEERVGGGKNKKVFCSAAILQRLAERSIDAVNEKMCSRGKTGRITTCRSR